MPQINPPKWAELPIGRLIEAEMAQSAKRFINTPSHSGRDLGIGKI